MALVEWGRTRGKGRGRVVALGGGGHSGTELLPTAKRPYRTEVVNA